MFRCIFCRPVRSHSDQSGVGLENMFQIYARPTGMKVLHRYGGVLHVIRKCKTSSAAAVATGHLPPVTLEAQAKVPTAYQSAIARHLIEQEYCRRAYDGMSFRLLSSGRTKRHLEVLEAVYIRTHSLGLCMQKNS